MIAKRKNNDVYFLEEKILLLERRLAIVENENHIASTKISSRWALMDVVLAIILVCIPIALGSVYASYSKVDTNEERIVKTENTVVALLSVVSNVQSLYRDYERKSYESIVEKCDSQIEDLESLLLQNSGSAMEKPVRDLLISTYLLKSTSLYYSNKRSKEHLRQMVDIGTRMIELDKKNWRGYQVRAYALWQIYDITQMKEEEFKQVEEDMEKSVRYCGNFNSNRINLPELYFVNNRFKEAAQSADEMLSHFGGDIGSYRSEGGQASFYLFCYISRYISTGDEAYIGEFYKHLNQITIVGSGRYDNSNVNKWFSELPLNHNPSIVDKKQQLFEVRDSLNKWVKRKR